MKQELSRVLDRDQVSVLTLAERYSACDARALFSASQDPSDVLATYTLRDQLYVEPQPDFIPDTFDLDSPVTMTEAEIAVASSHINVWRMVAQSDAPYTLILEDDVIFAPNLGKYLDRAWSEMSVFDRGNPDFDLFYLSYKEVKGGAPKALLSSRVFRPERGLWYLSGYILTKAGARKLIDSLPCRGPVDLWINQQFGNLDVRGTRRSLISQRSDFQSTNLYSILPVLSQIGVDDSGAESLYQQSPIHKPIFLFFDEESHVNSLAMAVSMLGYRCVSNINRVPDSEMQRLSSGAKGRIFDAYVNVSCLRASIVSLVTRHPSSKVIFVGYSKDQIGGDFKALNNLGLQSRVLRLSNQEAGDWGQLCEFLKLAPPLAPFPTQEAVPPRTLADGASSAETASKVDWLTRDPSPWIAPTSEGWAGMEIARPVSERPANSQKIQIDDDFCSVDPSRWLVRKDTFPGNLGLFHPDNVTCRPDGGLVLTVAKQSHGVRDFGASAISSVEMFLFGRFEVELQAAPASGLVTGFFLHRDSPRQEIDVEIAGNRPCFMLSNVFFNPGAEGARFDFGFRGAPARVRLPFDASTETHRFAIEWGPTRIRWFVDGRLVHQRYEWGPTPIPQLPMTLHINTWPTRSRELAGKVSLNCLPSAAVVRRVRIDAWNQQG